MNPSPPRKVWVPRLGTTVVFHPRSQFARRLQSPTAYLPPGVPVTVLPVDCTNAGRVSAPMDGNDSYGDCMEAMACHVDNIQTYGQGKAGWTESVFDQAALVAQYTQASGGDNGLDEPTLLQQCWKPGLAGNAQATYVDSMDVDVTDVALTQYLIDQFWHVCLMWSVPDAFINAFQTGAVFPDAMTPNPNNGHGTPLADVFGPGDSLSGINVNGFMRLWTWGGWAAVSPAFVASVQPATFVVFTVRSFNAKGFDSKGRHITKQAAAWQAAGGNAIPAAVINAFPPPNGPPPPPPPPGGVQGMLTITSPADAAGQFPFGMVAGGLTPAQQAGLAAFLPILTSIVAPLTPGGPDMKQVAAFEAECQRLGIKARVPFITIFLDILQLATDMRAGNMQAVAADLAKLAADLGL